MWVCWASRLTDLICAADWRLMCLDWKMDKNRWKLQEAETKVLRSMAAEGDLNSTRYSVLVKYDRRRENRAHRFKSYPVISSHVKEQPNWRRGNKKRSKTSNVFTGSQRRSQLSCTISVVVTLTTSDVQVLSAPIIFNNRGVVFFMYVITTVCTGLLLCPLRTNTSRVFSQKKESPTILTLV